MQMQTNVLHFTQKNLLKNKFDTNRDSVYFNYGNWDVYLN